MHTASWTLYIYVSLMESAQSDSLSHRFPRVHRTISHEYALIIHIMVELYRSLIDSSIYFHFMPLKIFTAMACKNAVQGIIVLDVTFNVASHTVSESAQSDYLSRRFPRGHRSISHESTLIIHDNWENHTDL